MCPIASAIARALCVPVDAYNITQASALAESRVGVATDIGTFVWLYVGSGVGSALVHEGQLEVGGGGIMRIESAGLVQGSEHSAGTVRMGSEPSNSACDPHGRLHETSNVFVADASLHPTNGGFNPGLTVMANAMRVAALLADSLKRR